MSSERRQPSLVGKPLRQLREALAGSEQQGIRNPSMSRAVARAWLSATGEQRSREGSPLKHKHIYKEQRNMVYNHTYNLKQVGFAGDGIKDAQIKLQ
jgi:hypothetical protein